VLSYWKRHTLDICWDICWPIKRRLLLQAHIDRLTGERHRERNRPSATQQQVPNGTFISSLLSVPSWQYCLFCYLGS
jgi:hypothetical protein